MADRMNLRVNADVVPADSPARPSDPAVLPIISGSPSALSPLAGRRMLVTIAQSARPGETPPLIEELAFEDALAMAAHLASLDLEIVMAPVGEAFTPEDARAIARIPGLSAWAGRPITRPRDDAAASAPELKAAADSLRADVVILHEPALAAARLDPRPTVVFCESSPVLAWRQRHGAKAEPEAVRVAGALERLGLHAADRVIVPSRALAAEIVPLHGLTLPPAIVPPVFRKPESHEKRSGEPAFIAAGAAQANPRDLKRLDGAAAQIFGQVLLFEMGSGELEQAPCLEQMHKLAPMPGASVEALLLRAAAFYSPSCGAGFERLVWRAASAGCAMILTDTKANREFWQGAAHFIQSGSEEALAASLRRMLEDDDYRRRLAAAGLRRARALAGGPAVAALQKVLASALGHAPLTATL